MKTIVVSAVNLNVGGTLTILRDCLQYLSQLSAEGEYRVIAIVHKKELAEYPLIEYIETPWPKKRWINRLWFEYVSLKKISKQIGYINLWLSLHDTTPNVTAKSQAVYCHNPFPFYQWSWKECFLAPKIVLFSLFSQWIYKKGIHKNKAIIVQQKWLKDEFCQRFGLPEDKVIVALPAKPIRELDTVNPKETTPRTFRFIYASSPNSHKNFECLCRATKILEQSDLMVDFEVCLTITGDENKYARWLYRKWGTTLKNLKFIGFQNRTSLFYLYNESDCLVFPSKVETWGLPISEFATFNKPMLLGNRPYAKETAAGKNKVSFFDTDNPFQLAAQMKLILENDTSFLKTVPKVSITNPVSHSWQETFQLLLKEKDEAVSTTHTERINNRLIGVSNGS